jgi:hypothetical protein
MTTERPPNERALEPESFRHDRSAYERPTARRRCGRGVLWGTPCPGGPNPDGSCGGTADCAPVRARGDRYECRRPVALGGACAEGPLPDGRCAHRRPPCSPRPTFRVWRGRFALVALGAVVALLVAFAEHGRLTPAGINSVTPGPLFGPHAGFAPQGACSTCHQAHGAGLGAMAVALFEPADMAAKCTACHVFEGNARTAHNTTFPDRPDLDEVMCERCHRDHRGADVDLDDIDDRACAGCHAKRFDDFATGHPPFPASYPHDRESAIKFDHASHIGKHFSDPKVADKAPTSCAACHDVAASGAAVLPKGYGETCAACHDGQIADRTLVILGLPEFAANALDAEAVTEACGPTLDAFERLVERADALAAGEDVAEDDEVEEYEAVSLDEMAAPAAFLLDVPVDDMEAYETPMQDLVMAMAADGTAPLAELVGDRLGAPPSALLAGLGPELAKRVACAWAANVEYEAPADAELGGWYGDYLELGYRPVGHGDPVVRAWIEAALAAGPAAEAMRDGLIDPKEGVGACAKCHAVQAAGDDSLEVAWRFRPGNVRPYDHYSHRAHLGLVQAGAARLVAQGAGCQVCHWLDRDADFAASFDDFDPSTFASNFRPIDVATCARCHAERAVRADCQLCHRYHLEASFAPESMGAALSRE